MVKTCQKYLQGKKILQYSTKKKGAKAHKQCILAFQGGT